MERDEKTLVAVFLRESIAQAAHEIRKTLAALPDDESRVEALHTCGFCRTCGGLKRRTSDGAGFETCFCTADD
jgi:hypothetical protein